MYVKLILKMFIKCRYTTDAVDEANIDNISKQYFLYFLKNNTKVPFRESPFTHHLRYNTSWQLFWAHMTNSLNGEILKKTADQTHI